MVSTCAALLALVTANVILGQAGFAHADTKARVTAKTLQVEQLELENARLRAPARIAERAEAIGLVPAQDVTLLVASEAARRDSSPSREER